MIVRYCVPYVTIMSLSVCMAKNKCEPIPPSSANTIQLMIPRNRPFLAASLAPSKFFSPRLRDSSALMPTPVPAATAIISVWMGKARETAVSASSLSCATNMLSTILYKACTSIESIIGRDMVISSLGTGMTPILFSCFCISGICSPPSCCRTVRSVTVYTWYTDAYYNTIKNIMQSASY